jgi:hypothetical protein
MSNKQTNKQTKTQSIRPFYTKIEKRESKQEDTHVHVCVHLSPTHRHDSIFDDE